MPVINRIAELSAEMTAWRRDLHENPELLFNLPRTSALVAEKLRAFGCDDVVTGIAQTGVVAVIRGRSNTTNRVIGLRADMDALPIMEANDLPYRSKVPGKMHACGHDGHTASLLGAAQYLTETRNFDGTAVLVFQPAEEGAGGARVMVEEGLFERFGIQEIYGQHNAPNLPVGQFGMNTGGVMASMDAFTITITGRGGHAATPEKCIDPILAGAHLITALQSIIGRNVDPQKAGVISVCVFNAGDAFNVIPQTATLRGTVRALDADVRDQLQERIVQVTNGVVTALGASVEIDYIRGYPVTVNHPDATAFAAEVAREIAGVGGVDTASPPHMGAEDFSFMLEKRPGAYIWFGNGASADLHHPSYNFNDDALPFAASMLVRIIERRMPLK